MGDELILADGYRVRFPVFVVVDLLVFQREGLATPAELNDDAVIGAYVPVYTTAEACRRAIRDRSLAGRRVAPLASAEDLGPVLTVLYRRGVPWVAFEPDDEGDRIYPLIAVLELLLPPTDD